MIYDPSRCAQLFDANGIPVIDGNNPKPWNRCINDTHARLMNTDNVIFSGKLCYDCLFNVINEYNEKLNEKWFYIQLSEISIDLVDLVHLV